MSGKQLAKLGETYMVRIRISEPRLNTGASAVTIEGNGDSVVDWDLLSELPDFDSLGLYDVTLTQSGWRMISRATMVRVLTFIGTHLPTNIFSPCVDPLRVERMYIANVPSEGWSLGGLCQFRQMRSLSVINVRRFRQEIEFLHHLRGLEELCLNGSYLGDSRVPSIAALKRLKELQLEKSGISRKALPALAMLEHLERLGIQGNGFDWHCLEDLATLHELRELTIDFDLPPESWPALRSLPNLDTLFTGGQISSSDREILSRMLGDVLVE